MKQSSEFQVILIIYTIDEVVSSTAEVKFISESLAVVLLSYDGEKIQDYDEVVVPLIGLGTCPKNLIKYRVHQPSLQLRKNQG